MIAGAMMREHQSKREHLTIYLVRDAKLKDEQIVKTDRAKPPVDLKISDGMRAKLDAVVMLYRNPETSDISVVAVGLKAGLEMPIKGNRAFRSIVFNMAGTHPFRTRTDRE